MPTTPETVYDLDQFSLKQMTECGATLRKLGAGVHSMEEAAKKTTGFLFESLISSTINDRAGALVRSYLTMPYNSLPERLQKMVNQHSADTASANGQCLTLLATRGIQTKWNDRLNSSHQVVPVSSPALYKRLPLVAQLLTQFGMEPPGTAKAKPGFFLDTKKQSYSVFFVPEAATDKALSSHDDFTAPNGIVSVVGFGGMLPSGSIFSIIIFSRASISRQTALAFRPFALNTKIAFLPFDEPALIFGNPGN